MKVELAQLQLSGQYVHIASAMKLHVVTCSLTRYSSQRYSATDSCKENLLGEKGTGQKNYTFLLYHQSIFH